MSSKYVKGTRLNDKTIERIMELFVLEVPAAKASVHLKVNRNTVQGIYTKFRKAIVLACEDEALLDGEVEVDESYFGGQRKGNRGRGAAGKVVVFGILKRKGQVYTRPVPNVSREILRSVIKQKIPEGSTIYSDSFRSYDGLITEGYKHYRINHAKEFARGKRKHINGIENFWGYAKTKLRRYYGIDRKHFFLYLKEMEFRFNHRHEDLLSIMKRIVIRSRKI
jgi:transposase